MTVQIVDLSHYQAGFDVTNLPGLGVQAVILKAGQYVYNPDSSFARFLQQARDAKIRVSAYWFIHEGRLDEQAHLAAQTIPSDIPVWVDAEAYQYQSGAWSRPTNDDAYQFIDHLLGYGRHRRSGIYHGSEPDPAYGGWWYARYPTNATGAPTSAYAASGGDDSPIWGTGRHRHPDLWQYTEKGRINGLYPVDYSAFRGTLDDLDATGWFFNPGAPATPPTPAIAPPGGGMRVVQVPAPDNRAFIIDGGHTYVADPKLLGWACRAAGQLLDPKTGQLWIGDPNNGDAVPFTIKVPGGLVDLLPGARDAATAATGLVDDIAAVKSAVQAAEIDPATLASGLATILIPQLQNATGVTLSDESAQQLAKLVVQFGFTEAIARLQS